MKMRKKTFKRTKERKKERRKKSEWKRKKQRKWRYNILPVKSVYNNHCKIPVQLSHKKGNLMFLTRLIATQSSSVKCGVWCSESTRRSQQSDHACFSTDSWWLSSYSMFANSNGHECNKSLQQERQRVGLARRSAISWESFCYRQPETRGHQ